MVGIVSGARRRRKMTNESIRDLLLTNQRLDEAIELLKAAKCPRGRYIRHKVKTCKWCVKRAELNG
jgi:hypothetical protein